ncbi:hypothetical protein [Pantoea agglomerans]|uniref:hypothetical protein n=1 Tax=Enterobacter agglomerans TaxID=549 RepID=UPI001653FBD2|nr:hypothetical protein [Pantoea agglomerans]
MSIKLSLKPKTPIKINSAIKGLMKYLQLTTSPSYLNLTKVENTRAGYCFNNCEDYASKNNCEVVYGWMIWEDRRNNFIEAEFHAIINEGGLYKDISPRFNMEDKVLFVKDGSRNCGRKEPNSWYSWSNIKIIDGVVRESPMPIEIIELDDIHSEIVYL